VGDPLDPWRRCKRKYQERLLELTAGMTSVDPKIGNRFVDDPVPTSEPSTGRPTPDLGG
jgi:hypothetical protein